MKQSISRVLNLQRRSNYFGEEVMNRKAHKAQPEKRINHKDEDGM
jgi:hypothetical protein